MSNEKKTIMAVGGHVGDAELTCGGVLATYALKGYQIITVALTGGERGNPSHMTVEEYRKQKEAEAQRFAELLGGEAIMHGLMPVTGNRRLNCYYFKRISL